MAKRVGGQRRKSRSKMRKNIRAKGKISLRKYFQSFKNGEMVKLKAEPAVQKGLYYLRFHGKTGIVKCKRGDCYEVEIKDGGIRKTIIVHPTHLQKVL